MTLTGGGNEPAEWRDSDAGRVNEMPAPVPGPGPEGGAQASTPAERPRIGRAVFVSAVVAALIGAGVGVGVYAAVDEDHAASPAISVTTQSAPAVERIAGTVTGAAALIGPSVVTINVSAGDQGAGTGSGVIIRPDGYVLTNNHVVTLGSSSAASSNRIVVTLANGSAQAASVVGTDPADDLAVVKLSNQMKLAPATFAKSSSLKVGQTVVAVGAPLGLSNTVTSGIVSALERPVQAGNSGESIFNAIQTDAAINPGNSGGPLVDLNGHVVGINSAIATAGSGSGETASSGNIGIGFAIPSDEATRIAAELIANGKASHAIIGVSVQASPAAQSDSPTSAAGATVTSVTPNGPAAKAGIKAGDVITSVGQQRIDDPTGLIAAVRSYAPGQTVPITISRNGASRTVQVTLAASTAG